MAEHDASKMQTTVEDYWSKIKTCSQDVLESMQLLKDHDAIKDDWNKKGISLLKLKNQMMMQYMLDLTLVLKAKVSGNSIKGHPAILRLIETRLFLEKTFGIEEKLKYEIQKMVKKHHFGDTGESDGLKYKANPNSFNVQSGDEDDDSEEDKEEEEDKDEGTKKKGKGVYKAPKVTPMPYTADETAEEKKQKRMERLMKKARNSSMMEDIRREFGDEPEEIVDTIDMHRIKADRKRKEKEEYEEKYFVRAPLTKKDKIEGRKMATMSSLDGILKFDNLSYLDDDAVDEPAAKRRKTSKGSKGKGKGKKGKGKRKFRH